MAHFTFDFIFALAIVYGTSLGFSFLRRWDIPVLAVEILAGIVFGAGLGIITSDSPGFGFFVSLAALGLLLIMFDAGLELDPDVIRRNPGRIGTLAAFTFLLPFGSGFALASSLGLSFFAAFLTGVTVSTTSLGLIYPLLEDFDLLGTDRGQVILAVVVLNDLLSVAALAYGITLGTSSAPLLGAGVVTVALVVLFFIVPFVLEPHISNTLREGIVSEPAKIGMFLMVVLALILDHLGIHAILGAFFAGLLIAT
ncbi:MAG: cation:proton antiporter, partial [Halodesulfurarchaeum sp.]